MMFNIDRAREIMEKYDLDVLIATHPTNVFYVSDFALHPICPGPPCPCLCDIPTIAVFPYEANIEPTLIIPKIQLDYYYSSESWIKDYRCYGKFYVYKSDDIEVSRLSQLEKNMLDAIYKESYSTIVNALVDVLKEKKLSHDNIGLDEKGLTLYSYEKIKKELGDVNLVFAGNIFYEIRMIKTVEEIYKMKKAAEINVKAIKAVLNNIHKGATEKELNEIYISVVRKESGYPAYPIIACGTLSGVPLTSGWKPSDKKVGEGDIIRIDCDTTYSNYYSDIARNAVVGEANRKLKKYHNALLDGHEEALNMITPGVKASEVYNKTVRKIKENISHYQRPHVGHGIGIECYNPLLSFSPECNITLEEGMTINLETPYYEIGFGGMNIETTILITKDGYQDFSENLDKELYIK